MPIVAIPMWSSLPAAFNLYWVITICTNLTVNLITRSTWFRTRLGVSDYLPGTKLARLNHLRTQEVIKPSLVYSRRPTKAKLT